jgi:ribose/xylose/arabinose/galactoside ABC-type transport system permease subunit
VLFLGVLQNGLSIAGISTYWQQVLTGIILVAAVLGSRSDVAARVRVMFRPRAAPE